ncbi:MAG: ABC transporter permease [endosymbiont of Escarpia spicata]|uniref:ABC transporter permease n=1 Tax=endosymbiont of Escarpia spicata TaxID=2200908 RepID=A0A370DD50_9GAMM|nr:MAG: ABC transporter permease [endosymbiont of Escarpia spicata]
MILTLAFMEWRRLMRTPLAWVLLAIALFLLSWQFLQILENFTGLKPEGRTLGLTHFLTLQLYGFAALLILFITPILAMRQFSDTAHQSNFTLLSSAPLSLTTIVFGKYLGQILFSGLILLLPLILSLSLMIGVNLDLGLLAAATLGLFLLTLCFSAIGLYLSSLSESPAIAAAGSYGLLLLLSILGQNFASETSGILRWFGWPGHLLNLQLGLVKSSDIIYFLLLTFFFIALTLQRLNHRRGQ